LHQKQKSNLKVTFFTVIQPSKTGASLVTRSRPSLPGILDRRVDEAMVRNKRAHRGHTFCVYGRETPHVADAYRGRHEICQRER
jgi:hypothetical protein